MAIRPSDVFTTIRSEGMLLPPELLLRIVDNDPSLEGLLPSDYHLSGERINEAINNAWNRARSAWKNFRALQETLADSDAGTTLTRERWLLPLFTALDYGRLQTANAATIDGKSYPISHCWGNIPIHLVSFRVDIDKRTPGIAGASANSPHSLMQLFLNRSPEHIWGLVSNGCRLRILRDNSSMTRQAYVEFNLEAMMDGEVYADFALFWMLCHQSRVEADNVADCWLEKWTKVADEQGTRALDQLRDSVETAIKALGTGFIKHPRNHVLREKLRTGVLDKQDYYRQLLRLVYRFLFLFAAEDRDLLLDPNAPEEARDAYQEHYSVRRIREIAGHFRGTTHPDQFEGLRLVMRLLGGYDNGKCVLLGLPVLGSSLFNDEFVDHIINCKISNRDLLEAIRALAYIQDRDTGTLRSIDYKHLGPEELGGVYESLLELHPEVNLPAQRFDLKTASGHDRKTSGSYFTPPSLISALLDSALDPVLAEALQARNPEEAILHLKVCDPACGSGSFLIAAAHRMAHALARVRAGEDEPSPAIVRTALRDVIGNCIYGVDINPMSVELCKVNLWIEALDPGKPLSFLDHHIKAGNSLLGTTPALMAQGIPDSAFEPVEGDDRAVATAIRKQNRQERKDLEKGQRSMFEIIDPPHYAVLTTVVRQVDEINDALIAGVRAKEKQWKALAHDPEYMRAHLLADAWCAAFVWEKKTDPSLLPMTQLIYERLCADPFTETLGNIREYIVQLRQQYHFFHWHIEFPDVFTVPMDPDTAENEQTGWNGGFSVVLGNPPWEKIQLEEQKFFASVDPEIATSRTSERKRKIKELKMTSPEVYAQYISTLRNIAHQSNFLKLSQHYPLSGQGNISTHGIFLELALQVADSKSRVGLIIPSSLATQEGYKELYEELVKTGRLRQFYDFENREKLFTAVDSRMKFAIVILSERRQETTAEYAFYLQNVTELQRQGRTFAMSYQDLLSMSPDTLSCPLLWSATEAQVLGQIYRNSEILFSERMRIDSWGWHSWQVFNEAHDADELLPWRPDWQNTDYDRLYEAKLIHQFDHRFATYGNSKSQGALTSLLDEDKADPSLLVETRYCVSNRIWEHRIEKRNNSRNWIMAFRRIARATDERTAIFAILPRCIAGHQAPFVALNQEPFLNGILLANLNSFVFDFAARRKLNAVDLSHFILHQLPVIQIDRYTPGLINFIVPRVLELTYTAWDLQSFAQDVGWDGPPFVWDEERRFLMRCELDALYFHLYGIERDDVDYIMETFPIVKRKDIAVHGEYLTKRVILEMYDQMAGLGLPDTPDCIRDYQTWLNPPPADPSVAHPGRE